jgi:hypothetical protein
MDIQTNEMPPVHSYIYYIIDLFNLFRARTSFFLRGTGGGVKVNKIKFVTSDWIREIAPRWYNLVIIFRYYFNILCRAGLTSVNALTGLSTIPFLAPLPINL